MQDGGEEGHVLNAARETTPNLIGMQRETRVGLISAARVVFCHG